MKARTWSIICVVCLLAAWLFWRLGNERIEEQRRYAPPPATNAVGGVPTSGTSVSLLTRLSPRQLAQASRRTVSPDPAATAEPPYRLRNTSRPLAELMRSDSAVLLRNALVDTASPTALEMPEPWAAGAEPGAFIIQARGPMDAVFRARLEQGGARIVSYIPNNAYLARASAAQARALRELKEVQAVLPFAPYFKLDPGLLAAAAEARSEAPHPWLLVTGFPDGREQLFSAATAAGALVLAEAACPFGPQVVVETAGADWMALARSPDVQLLEPCAPRRMVNDLTRVELGVAPDSVATTNWLGLTGSNVWVNVNDTGIDRTHPDLKDRVFGDGPAVLADPDGHGTHVAGIIASSGEHGPLGTNAQGSVEDASFRGLAPAAKLFALGVDLVSGPLQSDEYLITTAAATNYAVLKRTNALISNNSWVYVGQFDYNTAAASYDAATRDALPGRSGSQPMLYVFSAGNFGGGNTVGQGGEPGSIESPATAKNVITVGALENLRRITNEVVVELADGTKETNQVFVPRTDSRDQVADFSARGNVGINSEGDYGRFKPDLVAPGSFVVSTRTVDWDTNTPNTLIRINTFTNQLIQAGATNRYSLTVPEEALELAILILTNRLSPVPMPDLLINLYRDMAGTDLIASGVHSLTLATPPAGPLYYQVLNRAGFAVRFDLRTRLRLPAYEDNFFAVRNQLDAELVGEDGGEPKYRYESGTSMAAAAVSGLLALVQEHFERTLRRPYSPALLKALLINGARSVSTEYNFNLRRTINHQGWGLPTLPLVLPEALTNATDETTWPVRWVDQHPTNALVTGQTHTYELTVPETARNGDLRITLVWTDPPGNPAASTKLVNDLDLYVSNRVTGVKYAGNDLPADSDYNSPWGTNQVPAFDNVNNVENVFLRGPVDTNWVIQVHGRRINVNAVTAHPYGIAQDYALVVSTTSQTNALAEFRPAPLLPAGPTNEWVSLMTNGIPLLKQKVGANSPLLGYPRGISNQWHFYVFTNTYTTNSVLTNGPYVAFLTFTPPNLSVPRNVEADIDLYVTRSRDGGVEAARKLLDLDPATVAAAYSSRERAGSEQVLFDDAAEGEVFFIGVKSEDQMASEYSFSGISQQDPFETLDDDGSLVMRGTVLPNPIPDGTPNEPGGVNILAIGVTPVRVGNATVELGLAHEQPGDLVGNLSHNGQFAVLNNHARPEDTDAQVLDAVYDDSGSGELPFSLPSDGPGSLRNFLGQRNTGAWMLTMVDNALSQTGLVYNFTVRVRPAPDLLIGVYGSVLANQWNYYVFEVPADASRMTVLLQELSGPLNVYLRRGAPPTLTDYDKAAFLVPPGGSLSLGIRDVPPLQAGLYFIGLYNPTAVTVEYFLRVILERELPGSFRGDYRSTNRVYLSDDARTNGVIVVQDDRIVTDVKVGLRVDHERVSDLDFHLVSPRGSRALVVENRGGTNLAQLGFERVETNFHHVALTYSTNSGLASLYLDGELLVAEELGTFRPDTTTDLYLGYGATNALTSNQFRGLLDEVDVYDRALSAAEILAIYKYGGAGKPLAGLISRWAFDGDGADVQANNPAVVVGPTYVPGRFGASLRFGAEGDLVVVTNQTGLDVGGGGGFTVDAWVSPFDLSEARTIAAWTDLSNRVGVLFGLLPGPDTNALPGTLYASLPDAAGLSNRMVVAPRQGLLSTNWLQTNLVFTVLTDNTNQALLPIKFGQPATNAAGARTNQLISGFEQVEARKTAEFAAGASFEGWSVGSNEVAVLQSPLAHTGTNLLVLKEGVISRDLVTEAGKTYRLQWAHRQQPSFEDIVSWWPGEGDAQDLVGTNHGTVLMNVAYDTGMVGRAFRFAANAGLIEVATNTTLDLTNQLTLEMWFLAGTNLPYGGGMLGKREDPFGTPPFGANYGASLSTAGLEIWFNDTNRSSVLADPPAVGGYERLRFPTAPRTNEFHHFAGTFRQVAPTQVELQIYLDGRLQATRVLPGVLRDTVNDAPLLIGATLDGVDGFNGLLDEITLYRRALSAEEIAQIYLLDRVGKAVPPVAARAQMILGGTSTNTFASDVRWATNGVAFLATTNLTRLTFASVAPDVMLDSIELIELEANVFLPEEPFQPLLGESALGAWRLEVTDRRTGATNVIPPELIRWQLELSYGPNLIEAVRLTNHVAYGDFIPPSGVRYFYTDVPRSARFATNTLRSDGLAMLGLWFNQDGVPLFDPAAGDYQLLTNVTDGIAVLATNGVYQVDTNGVELFPPVNPPRLQPGQRYYLAVTNDDAATPYTIQVDFDAEDTEILGLTLLGYGETIVTNIAVTNALQYYRYDVSTNAAAASFEVYPTNGNVNLYLRKARQVLDPLPTPRVFDYASENPGTNAELIVVTQNSPVPLGSGPWYLGVLNADTNVVDYRIRVVETTNVVEELVVLTNAVPRADTVSPAPVPAKYFVLRVSNAPPSLQFDLTGLSGEVVLYADQGSKPTTNTFLRADQAQPLAPGKLIFRTNAFLPSLDGDWYLAVVPSGSSPVSFVLTGSFPAVNQGATPLQNHVPLSRTLAADTFGLPPVLDYFTFEVGTEISTATFAVTPVDGDLDLLLRLGAPPDLDTFDYASATSGLAPESLVVTTNSTPVPLAPGTWYLGVVNQGFNSATYTVRVDAIGAEITINPDVSFSGGRLTLTWDAPCGLNFVVEYATAIPETGPIVWTDTGITASCSGGQYSFTDDPAITGTADVKFFRVVLLP
jgi:subtilisin-like proprotein convertase family protein